MIKRLFRNERGAGAVEFALAAPVLLGMVIGASQLGLIYHANAGIKHAVEDAARVASVFPTPPEADIRAELEDSRFGMSGTLTPTITTGKAADDMPVMDISLSYTVPVDFIFFKTPPVRLSHSRRVYLQSTGSSTPSTTSPSTPTSPDPSPPADGPPGQDDKGKDPEGNGNNGKKDK